jgi:hypothetical protein
MMMMMMMMMMMSVYILNAPANCQSTAKSCASLQCR